MLPLRIVGAGCHGKFIYVMLEGGRSIWSTLGMTGGWTTNPDQDYIRFALRLASDRQLYFRDKRNFGTIKFVTSPAELRQKLESLGPDMMTERSDLEILRCLRKRDEWNVCKALMDQKVIAGVGNYVKAESLWRAKINPHATIGELDDDTLIDLKKHIENVLHESYNAQGASIRDYRRPDGGEGEYTFHMRVYGKKLDEEGNKVRREGTPDGRTTHWSPQRQVIPFKEE